MRACSTAGTPFSCRADRKWYRRTSLVRRQFRRRWYGQNYRRTRLQEDKINLTLSSTIQSRAPPLIPSANSYSVGPDNRGCLTLTDNSETTFTFHFSLGGITGDIIFFNEQSTTPERGSGILRRQDPTASSLSALATNLPLARTAGKT